MNVQILENFLSNRECESLSRWIIENKDKQFFTKVDMGGNRISTRFTCGMDWQYPSEAYDVRKRLVDALKVRSRLHPPYKDGIVASCALPGDFVFEHTDPVWFEDHVTVHCNVVVSEPDAGGLAIICGKQYNMSAGNVLCYPVSELPHKVTKIEGSKFRLMWVFGFCIHKSDIV